MKRVEQPDIFETAQVAYYARVVENPSCRAYTRACDAPSLRRYAQERA